MTLLTNFKKEKLPRYQKAIKCYEVVTSKRNDLIIRDYAYDNRSTLLPDTYALHIYSAWEFFNSFLLQRKLELVFPVEIATTKGINNE